MIGKRSLVLFAVLLAAAPFFNGCGGGGSSPTGTTTLNIAGIWDVRVVITETTCGFEVGEVRTGIGEMVQDGTNVTEIMREDNDVALRGTLIDNQFKVEGSFSDPPWSLILRNEGTVDAAAMRISGTATFDWTRASSADTCREKGTYTATKR